MIVTITDRNVESAIAQRLDFVTPGSARGFHPARHPDLPLTIGVLPEAWIDQYILGRGEIGIDYVIMSFDTPIAWVTTLDEVIIPRVKYSRTTSRLQNRARAALGVNRETPH